MGIQVTATGGIVRIGMECICGVIPETVLRDMINYLLDKNSGNMIFRVQHGIVLGGRFEKVVSYVNENGLSQH